MLSPRVLQFLYHNQNHLITNICFCMCLLFPHFVLTWFYSIPGNSWRMNNRSYIVIKGPSQIWKKSVYEDHNAPKRFPGKVVHEAFCVRANSEMPEIWSVSWGKLQTGISNSRKDGKLWDTGWQSHRDGVIQVPGTLPPDTMHLGCCTELKNLVFSLLD